MFVLCQWDKPTVTYTTKHRIEQEVLRQRRAKTWQYNEEPGCQ